MLDANLKQQLNTYLQYIVNPIEICVSGNNSEKSAELLALATEISEMSDKIMLRQVTDGRQPAMGIAAQGAAARVHFAGLPMGHEFTSLVLALLQTGGHPSKTDPAILEQIQNLKGKFHFETYISLSCHNCPDVVQALNLMATINPNITHVMIDGALFQDEVSERQIMAVPNVYLNGQPFSQGRITLEQILAKVDTSSEEDKVAELNALPPYDVLIVGGGPAGAAAAVYAGRKGIKTAIVTDQFGGQIMDTMGIENLITVPYTEGPKLAANLEQLVKENGIDIIREQRVKHLKKNDHIEISLANGATLKSQTVILATGARWRDLNVPGEQEYRTKGVAYCPHCDGPFFKGKKVAVIGGGNSGIEAAIDLAGIVEHVTVLEFADTLRADEVLQKKARSLSNVTIITNARTTEVLGDGSKVTGLSYEDRLTGNHFELGLAGIFVQIGLVPNTDFLKETDVSLTRFGEIEIDSKGATSILGVFAAGDATTTPYKQIVISMGSGATAALSAFDYLIRHGKSDS